MNYTVKTVTKNSLITFTILLQILAFPLTVYAEDILPTPADTSSETPVSTTVPEPAPAPAPEPTPAPAAVPEPVPLPNPEPAAPAPVQTPTPVAPEPVPYTLNPETGMYENDKYIWDPVTFQTKPKVAPTYSFNPTTNMWETTEWRYDTTSGSYVPNVITASPVPPAGINQESAPLYTSIPTSPSSQSTSPLMSSGLGSSSYNTPTNNLADLNNPVSDTFFGAYYNAQISNSIYSTARSGDVAVTQNTVAGNALSGSASAIANIINILQSSWSPGGSGNISTFVANIDGDVVGDLMIDPGQLANQNLKATSNSSNPDVTVQVQNNGVINNDIQLAAQSGNAAVSENTIAGNATSGNATALANVVNVINSTIASGQSFFGVLNINGNFNGDILVPPSILDYLLASSAPRATISMPNPASSELKADITNNQNIINNVAASANSGQANVSGNTSAGNATSGSATTDVTILNLTGSNVIASNSLLVFVNVLGEWVGLIVNAPAGSTSAAYAGGVSANNSLLPGTQNVDMDITNNSTIHNNINVSAQTGNADVSKNTQAGNATSGDAKAGVSLLNIMNSNLAFSDWFGVLFINVLGTWHGSFGIDTAAGNTTLPPETTNTGSGPVFVFKPDNRTIPVATASTQRLRVNNGAYVINETPNDPDSGVVAGAVGSGSAVPPNETPVLNNSSASVAGWIIAAAIIAALIIAYFVWRRIQSVRAGSSGNQIPLSGPLPS